jgi:hypothetical protein
VGDGGPDLALDVVADDRHAGGAELLGPFRNPCDEDRQAVHEADAGVDRALGVEPGGILGAHREVADHHVRAGLTKSGDHVDRIGVALVDHLPVVLAQSVEGVAALHRDVQRGHVSDLDGVVLAGEDPLGQVASHLLGVDVEGRHEGDVAYVVRAQLDVHEPGDAGLRVGVPVVLDPLDE